MTYNDFSDPDNYKLNQMLPSYIDQCGLAEKDFSITRGGNFHCPVCGHSIGLFWKNSANPPRWCINTYGKCRHFGINPEYPNDATGIYLAITGQNNNWENLQDAKSHLIGVVLTQKFIENISEKKKEEENYKKLATEKNIELVRTQAQWGRNISEKGRMILKKRDIDIEKLPQDVIEQIGFVENLKLFHLFKREDGKTQYDFGLDAILFALGQKIDGNFNSFQGRRISEDNYEKEHKYRFLNIGTTDIFLTNQIDRLQEPDFTKALFITEGPFDCLSYYMNNSVAISVQGAGNLKKIIAKLSEILKTTRRGTIIVDYDLDDAGQTGSSQFIKAIKEINPETLILKHPGFYPSCKDCNDFLRFFPEDLKIQTQILNEIAYLYKKRLLTKTLSIMLVDIMQGRKKQDWIDLVQPVLKEIRKIEKIY